MNPRDMNSGFQAVMESNVAGPRLKEENHKTGREGTNGTLVNPGKGVEAEGTVGLGLLACMGLRTIHPGN